MFWTCWHLLKCRNPYVVVPGGSWRNSFWKINLEQSGIHVVAVADSLWLIVWCLLLLDCLWLIVCCDVSKCLASYVLSHVCVFIMLFVMCLFCFMLMLCILCTNYWYYWYTCLSALVTPMCLFKMFFDSLKSWYSEFELLVLLYCWFL